MIGDRGTYIYCIPVQKGPDMNLNLHLLSDVFKEPDYCCILNSDPLRFPLEYPAVMRECPDVFSERILYIMPAECIPPGMVLPAHSSVVCTGSPKDRSVETEGDLVYTGSEDIGCDRVMNMMAEEFHRYRMWESLMENAVRDGSAFGRMAAAAGRLLGNPLEVWEASVYLVCFYFPEDTGDVPFYKTFLEDHPWSPGYVMSEDELKKLMQDREYVKAIGTKGAQIYEGRGHGFRTLYQNVIINDVPVARICVSEILKPFTEHDRIVVSLFAKYMEEAFSGRSVLSFGEGNRYLNVIHGMLDRKLQSDAAIQRFLAEQKWRMHDEYVCLTIASKHAVEKTGSDLAAVSIRLVRALSSSCCLFHEGRIVFICNLTRLKKSRDYTWRVLSPLLRENMLTAGISTEFCDFKDLYYFYEQAMTAEKTGVSYDPDRGCYPFEEYQIQYLLKQYQGCLHKKALIPPGLERLMRYDKEKNTEFIRTLRIYLDSACSTARTISQLHLHRNSLAYRLERIGEVTGMDLDDPDHRLVYALALRLLDEGGNGLAEEHS